MSMLAVFAHPDDESLAPAASSLVTQPGASVPRWSPDLGRRLAACGGTGRGAADPRRGRPRMLGYADAVSPESAPAHSRFDAPLDEAIVGWSRTSASPAGDHGHP